MGRRKNKRKKRIKVKANMSNQTTPEYKYKVDAKSSIPRTTILLPREYAYIPIVFYTPLAWVKMHRAIEMCSDEVGWLGTVDVVEGVGYLIEDIFVPEQKVHGAETEILPEAMAELACSLEHPDKLKYWGHSHVNMGVTPSGQDEDQTSEYLEHTDFFIRGIYNKKGDQKVDVFDMTSEIVYQCVPNKLWVDAESLTIMEEFEAGVKENVKKFTRNTTSKAGSTTRSTGNNTTQSNSTQIARINQDKSRRGQNPFIVSKGGAK